MKNTPPYLDMKHQNIRVEKANFINPVATYAVIGLFIMALFYTLHVTKDFMIPVFAAVLLNLILSPLIRLSKGLGIGASISSAIVVLSLLGIVIGGVYSLSDPVTDWVNRIPEISKQIDKKMSILKEPIENVQKASAEVEKITEVNGNEDASQEVVIKEPGLLKRISGSLRYIAIQTILVFILLYFLLSVGDIFKRKLIKIMPNLTDKLKAERITSQIEVAISRYLLTITMINIGLGAAIAGALYFLGMPNPLLWGIMAMLFNFIPYIGAFAGILIVGVVSLIAFDTLSQALLAPLIYGGLQILEAQIITPSILSQRLTLNPVVVFLTVSFWAWFWGIPGALMAVPILVVLKIISDHVVGLQAIGEFLSGDHKHAFVVASEKWEAER